MFKKNPNRPPIIIELKKIPNGYKVQTIESHSLFVVKRITRTMYRPDLVQASNMNMENQGINNSLVSSTIIQPPSHVTLPAFASWFSLQAIHPIEVEFFPQFFQEQVQNCQFSFGCKNSKLYKYYRNVMIGMWRENVKKYLSSAQCRRNLLGDVSSIVRIHGFLENWGLINFPSKQHSKGQVISKSDKLSCYICEDAHSPIYHIAPVEQVLFQICDSCFQADLYSQQISADQFIQVLSKNYKNIDNKLMNNSQLIRLLQILNQTTAGSRDKDKDAWSAAQKQFSQYTREELVYNFLRIPLIADMNANIFENNEDVTEQHSDDGADPSVFQDYQNPLQTSIAISYYKWKTQKDQYPKITAIFKAAQTHALSLAQEQQQKIEQVVKMLVQVTFSKLQLKSLFIYEYQKLIKKWEESQNLIIANNLAESLKLNLRLIQRSEEPEQLFAFHESPQEECDGMNMLDI